MTRIRQEGCFIGGDLAKLLIDAEMLLLLVLATVTAVQVAAPALEIMDTTS
jgi:hypothetical protein